MRKEIHQSKCEEWEKLINQWIGSGLSKKQWCNENNINVRQLRYWQRVLNREVTGQNDSDNSGGKGCDANEPVDTASLVSPSGGFYEMPSSRQPNSKHRVISDDCENECLRPELVIDGHEMADEETTGNLGGEIINFVRDCRKNPGKGNKKERKKADFSGLPQINRYTLEVEAMDRKYSPGRWYVMS